MRRPAAKDRQRSTTRLEIDGELADLAHAGSHQCAASFVGRDVRPKLDLAARPTCRFPSAALRRRRLLGRGKRRHGERQGDRKCQGERDQGAGGAVTGDGYELRAGERKQTLPEITPSAPGADATIARPCSGAAMCDGRQRPYHSVGRWSRVVCVVAAQPCDRRTGGAESSHDRAEARHRPSGTQNTTPTRRESARSRVGRRGQARGRGSGRGGPTDRARDGGATVRIGTASWTDPTMTAGTVFYPTRRRQRRGTAPVLRQRSSRWSRSTATYYALPVRAHGRAVARSHAARLHLRRQGPRADDRPADRGQAAAQGHPRGAARRAGREAADLRARPAARSCATRSGRCSWTASSRCARPASWARSCSSTRAGSSRSARVAKRSSRRASCSAATRSPSSCATRRGSTRRTSIGRCAS